MGAYITVAHTHIYVYSEHLPARHVHRGQLPHSHAGTSPAFLSLFPYPPRFPSLHRTCVRLLISSRHYLSAICTCVCFGLLYLHVYSLPLIPLFYPPPRRYLSKTPFSATSKCMRRICQY